MVDPNVTMGNEINPVFKEVGEKINSQLQQLIAICEQHDDIHWLCSKFADVLNGFSNETISSSVEGIGFYVEADISTWNGAIEGPCWFFLTVDDAAWNYSSDEYLDYMNNTYDGVADNGNLCIAESTYTDNHPQIELLVPRGLDAYVRAKWVCEQYYAESTYEEDEIPNDSDILVALNDFAKFIEDCCQDAIDEVSIAIRRKYRYQK